MPASSSRPQLRPSSLPRKARPNERARPSTSSPGPGASGAGSAGGVGRRELEARSPRNGRAPDIGQRSLLAPRFDAVHPEPFRRAPLSRIGFSTGQSTDWERLCRFGRGRLDGNPGSVVWCSLSSAGAGTARFGLLWATFSRPGPVSPQVRPPAGPARGARSPLRTTGCRTRSSYVTPAYLRPPVPASRPAEAPNGYAPGPSAGGTPPSDASRGKTPRDVNYRDAAGIAGLRGNAVLQRRLPGLPADRQIVRHFKGRRRDADEEVCAIGLGSNWLAPSRSSSLRR